MCHICSLHCGQTLRTKAMLSATACVWLQTSSTFGRVESSKSQTCAWYVAINCKTCFFLTSVAIARNIKRHACVVHGDNCFTWTCACSLSCWLPRTHTHTKHTHTTHTHTQTHIWGEDSKQTRSDCHTNYANISNILITYIGELGGMGRSGCVMHTGGGGGPGGLIAATCRNQDRIWWDRIWPFSKGMIVKYTKTLQTMKRWWEQWTQQKVIWLPFGRLSDFKMSDFLRRKRSVKSVFKEKSVRHSLPSSEVQEKKPVKVQLWQTFQAKVRQSLSNYRLFLQPGLWHQTYYQ